MKDHKKISTTERWVAKVWLADYNKRTFVLGVDDDAVEASARVHVVGDLLEVLWLLEVLREVHDSGEQRLAQTATVLNADARSLIAPRATNGTIPRATRSMPSRSA